MEYWESFRAYNDYRLHGGAVEDTSFVHIMAGGSHTLLIPGDPTVCRLYINNTGTYTVNLEIATPDNGYGVVATLYLLGFFVADYRTNSFLLGRDLYVKGGGGDVDGQRINVLVGRVPNIKIPKPGHLL